MIKRKEGAAAEHEWVKEFPGAVTVCDETGVILEMNNQAVRTFKGDGGAALIGKNIFDCHPEPSRTKLKNLMAERCPNIYTIEKKGVKKLIFQTPWTLNRRYRGFVELSLEIPLKMSHYRRKT